MIGNSNKRLANVKSRNESGFEYVLTCIDVITPFGKSIIKGIKPFFPGQEEELSSELDELQSMVDFAIKEKNLVDILQETFMEIKDSIQTIKRSEKNTLSVVEIFEIKSLLLQMAKICTLCKEAKSYIPAKFILEDVEDILNILDPQRNRLNTFYIYDEFSPRLGELRKEKKEIEISLRKEQKKIKEDIQKTYGVMLTPKFDIVVSKSNKELEKIANIEELEQWNEDYISITYRLRHTKAMYAIAEKIEKINFLIEEEEVLVREALSKEIWKENIKIISNCSKIGALDFTICKAKYATNHSCIRPEIINEHKISFKNGRHLKVEDVLLQKKKEYCPVSIELEKGVTCITGANMGGKTISLKLVALVSIMAQYGFFVPCTEAKVGLSNFIQMLIGDSQSVERGLSSFGSEMEELKEMLDNSKERSLLLIDEMASGTNPIEGLALTKSVVDFIKEKPYITLMTTHYEAVTEENSVKNVQVRGLANADFKKLDSEIRYATRKERINIISKYMDYSLYIVDKEEQIPKDALNIAKMLGISKEIIDGAKKYIKKGD